MRRWEATQRTNTRNDPRTAKGAKEAKGGLTGKW